MRGYGLFSRESGDCGVTSPLYCEGAHVAIAVAELPALSTAIAVRANALPLPLANRSAPSTVNPPEPLGMIATAGGLEPDDGLLLVTLTVKEPATSPDTASVAVTVATCTNFGFTGEREQ